MDESTKAHLHRQLIKLGDMLGDGLGDEPGGAWIRKEYRETARALGYDVSRPRANNSTAINEGMAKALDGWLCKKCGSDSVKQSRSGSLRAVCGACGARFQFKRSRTS